MTFYPLFLKITGKKCLIVGGGHVAFQKAKGLYKAGVILDVVAPDILDDFKTLDCEGRIFLKKKKYQKKDLPSDCVFVVCATDDSLLNQSIYEQASSKNILVNVVDQPSLCSAIVPAVIDRSPLLIALSSSAKAAMISSRIRDELVKKIPETYADLINVVERIRPQIAKMGSFEIKQKFWEYLLDDHIHILLSQPSFDLMLTKANRYLTEFKKDQVLGSVSIIGAGPGDPELLTLKAYRLLNHADVVLYDCLVGDGVLDFARRGARLINVGKRGYSKQTKQNTIFEMIKMHYQAGKRVVRLKGGDPFIFGRGGEEMDYLMEQNIPFEMVPGISAANGCASYCNIPLTHRDFAHSVEFLTLHGDGSKKLASWINWEKAIDPMKTLVFFMARANLDICIQKLQAHDMPPDMPMAFISKGTTENQHVVKTQLEKAWQCIGDQNLQSPMLIIVGRVVNLA